MELVPEKLKAHIQSRNHQLVLAMVGLLLFSLWAFVAFWASWERNAIVASNTLVLQQLTNAVKEQTDDLFQQTETALLTSKLWLETHPNRDPSNAPEFTALVDTIRHTSRGVLDIRMVTRTGELRRIPENSPPPYASLLDREYVRAQLNGQAVGFLIAEPVVGKTTQKWTIPVSVPVAKAGGNIAVLVAAIELDSISATFDAQRLKPSGTIAIISNSGNLLFRSPPAPSQYGKPIASEAEWRRYLTLPSSGVLQIDKSPVDGASRLVSYVKLKEYPLVVLVTVGTDALLQPWLLHTLVLMGVAGFITVLTLVYGYILLRSMSKEMAAKSELEKLMLTDPLTNVGNRRYLTRLLDAEVLRSERYGRPLTVVFFDLDHFKSVNDNYGHKVGDLVLVRVAVCLNSTMRQSDSVGRFGGEEFVMLLTETTVEDALVLVERMREAVGELKFPEIGEKITISAGLAQRQSGESAEALLQRSDRALYQAKTKGRNRACVDQVPTAKDESSAG